MGFWLFYGKNPFFKGVGGCFLIFFPNARRFF